VCFRDPLGALFLSVDPKRNPAGDPVKACQTEAAQVKKTGDLPQYKLIGITSVAPTIRAADWEYTYAAPSGVRMHAITRWFKDGSKAYTLTWGSRDFDWPTNQTWRGMIIGSFERA
jgi:hypothetical protein